MSPPRVKTLIAALAGGLLWLYGTGLHPVAALTWLAPLPLFLNSLRVRPRAAALSTILAWLIGQTELVGYYHGTLQMPLVPAAVIVALGAVPAAGTVLLARALLLRGRTVTAVLGVPSLWVLSEYLVSRAFPDGAWWSLAYTQAGVRPVVQLTALTGIWGVTYLLLAAPIALTALVAHTALNVHTARPPKPATPPKPAPPLTLLTLLTPVIQPRPAPIPRVSAATRAAACLGALVLAVGGWAVWSMNREPAGSQQLTVGLAAFEQSEDSLPIDRGEGRDLLAKYVTRAGQLAARGARVIVLPEKVFAVDDATLPLLVGAFQPVTYGGVQVIAGAVLRHGGTAANVAFVLGAGGVRTYAKQYLLTGFEDWITPGRSDVMIDGRFGVAICKDLDFPGLVRRYRGDGATVMLVPALDFTRDGWLHSRMALVRGIESGLTVVRAAGAGRSTVSDPGGRLLGEAVAGNADLLVTVRTAGWGTVYGRTGNGVWILIFGIGGLVAVASATTGRSRRRVPGESVTVS